MRHVSTGVETVALCMKRRSWAKGSTLTLVDLLVLPRVLTLLGTEGRSTRGGQVLLGISPALGEPATPTGGL